jgi:predicted acyl esterase
MRHLETRRPACWQWLVFVLAAPATVALGARGVLAQGLEYVKANYTKYEYRIPMRDGKRLFTAVYAPKERSHPWPVILVRTPYSVGPYGADQYRGELWPSALFAKAGYIFAYQDVRGRWMSEGEFVNMRPEIDHRGPPAAGVSALTPAPSAGAREGRRALTPGPSPKPGEGRVDESTDTWDTIDWLVKNVRNNTGRVGTWGISYPGFYVAAGMIDAHPALKVASPQAPIADWFVGDDWHHNGALMLPHVFNFMANFGHPRPEPIRKSSLPRFEHGTPDGYRFFLDMGPLGNADARYFKGDVPFWNEVMRHGTYDAFWKSRNLRPHLKNIRPAVMTVGGWFDAENLFGALETYKSVEAQSPQATNVLVMGPWVHGGWSRGDGSSLGPVQFGAKTSEFFRQEIELPFFEYYLKGTGAIKNPEAWVFETGTNRWRRFDAWPPKQAQRGDGWRWRRPRLWRNMPTLRVGMAPRSRNMPTLRVGMVPRSRNMPTLRVVMAPRTSTST